MSGRCSPMEFVPPWSHRLPAAIQSSGPSDLIIPLTRVDSTRFLPLADVQPKSPSAAAAGGVLNVSLPPETATRRSLPVSDPRAIFDTEGLWRIIFLSLWVSLSATMLAALFGAPRGAALAACPISGRQILVVAACVSRASPSGRRSGASTCCSPDRARSVVSACCLAPAP